MATLVGSASEADVIAAFLGAEIDSPRFSKSLKASLTEVGASEHLVRAPRFDADSNATRRAVLAAYRGWGSDQGLFDGLPTRDVKWSWIDLQLSDLRDRTYSIAWYFDETFGTRRLDELGVLKRDNDLAAARDLLAELRLGRVQPPILMSQPRLERLVILEGHNRLISYMTDPALIPFPLRALVGTTQRIAEWSEW